VTAGLRTRHRMDGNAVPQGQKSESLTMLTRSMRRVSQEWHSASRVSSRSGITSHLRHRLPIRNGVFRDDAVEWSRQPPRCRLALVREFDSRSRMKRTQG
jgi:hypothetical protein